MSIKDKFVSNGIKKPKIEEFLRSQFERCGYSHAVIKRTPVGMRITVYANKPGLVIGKGGENINKISELLKERFDFENPRIDVQEIENPYKKASIVAEEIKNALERGINYKRIGNIMLSKIMESGAIGVEIRISGKMGSRGRTQRFYDGYLKYSGETAKRCVDYAVTNATTKAGSIGIKVRILKENPETSIVKIKKAVEKEEKVTEEGKFECPHCGKIYEKERSLKIHIGQKHSDQEAKEETGEKTKEDKKVVDKKEKTKKKKEEKPEAKEEEPRKDDKKKSEEEKKESKDKKKEGAKKKKSKKSSKKSKKTKKDKKTDEKEGGK